MISFRSVNLLLLLAWPVLSQAQETRFIDLTALTQHTDLRYPQAPTDCKEGICRSSVSRGIGVGDGAPDRRDPRSLGIYLLRVTPTDIDATQPFEVDFQVRNTGTVPIEIPVSPHLSNLQPSDESVTFSYSSLALVVTGDGEVQGAKAVCMGFVELYGSPDHGDSMISLKPGEWIRVRANIKLRSSSPEPLNILFRGEFWLRKNTFKPMAGGGFTQVDNLYPNTTPTPAIAVRLLPAYKDQPKR